MQLVRHNGYYILGRLASAMVGMLSLFVLTRLLSPANYGRYSVIIAMSGLIAGVGFQWLRQCLVKFRLDPALKQDPLLGTLGVLFLTLLALVLVAASLIILDIGTSKPSVSGFIIWATVILAGSQAWFEFSLDATRADLAPKKYGAANFLRAIFCLGIGVLGFFLTQRLTSLILGISLGYLTASIFAAPRWLLGLAYFRKANYETVKKLASYGLPLALTLSFTFIVDSADRLMIAVMKGTIEAGVYSSAYNLAQFSLGSILSGLGLAIFPLAVTEFAKNGVVSTGNLLAQNLLLLVGVALPAGLGLIVVSPTLARLILGNFVPGLSVPIMVIIAIGIFFAAVRSYAFDIVFMLRQKTGQQAAIIGSAAIVNILLNLAFIPKWGALGAAVATSVTFALAFCLSIFWGRRLIKIHLPTQDLIKVGLSTVVMVLFLLSFPSHLTWSSLSLRVALGMLVYFCTILTINPADVRARVYEKLCR